MFHSVVFMAFTLYILGCRGWWSDAFELDNEAGLELRAFPDFLCQT